MEFKEQSALRQNQEPEQVLIESDWNLKMIIQTSGKPLWKSINRIRLEFKDLQLPLYFCYHLRINRIRLEFKGVTDDTLFMQYSWYNRIRLEFKGLNAGWRAANYSAVLIESDWNLKSYIRGVDFLGYRVLIESDWNLKLVDDG